MTAESIYLIGNGGHSRVVRSVLRALQIPVEGILDDDEDCRQGLIDDIPLLGPIRRLAELPPRPVVIAIGDNATRRRVAELVSVASPPLIHPSAIVDPGAVVGAGTVVMAGAIIQTGAQIGSHAIVNTGAVVDHDCCVGDFAHLCPGSRLAGEVTVAAGVLFGTGAVSIPNIRIGDWAVVGAGSVVIRDIPPAVVAVGNPAAPIRDRNTAV